MRKTARRRPAAATRLGRAAAGVAALGALGFAPSAAAVPVVRPRVVGESPHDPAAFTQGLVYHEGQLLESTGLYGRSSLRRVDRASGAVLARVALSDDEFGEGLAKVGDRLVQLTWQAGVAHVYDLASFDRLTQFHYPTEGWGLCHDGRRLVMTDGSDQLYFRDAQTFELLGQVSVTRDGAPVANLNELECVGSEVYANVWQTDLVLRIDPEQGRVLTQIDASGLLTARERSLADVLNGIAFVPETGHFLLTGKLWPRMFEVELPTGERPKASSSSCALGPARASGRSFVLGYAAWAWLLALIAARRRGRRLSSVDVRSSDCVAGSFSPRPGT